MNNYLTTLVIIIMTDAKLLKRKIEAVAGLYDENTAKFIYYCLKNERAMKRVVTLATSNNQTVNPNKPAPWGSALPFGVPAHPVGMSSSLCAPSQPSFPVGTILPPETESNFKVKEDQVYFHSKEEIIKGYSRLFKINVAFSPTETILPKVLFMSKDYPEHLPKGYTFQDDNDIFKKFVLQIPNMARISVENPTFFNEIHLFLIGFEYYLANQFIPSYHYYCSPTMGLEAKLKFILNVPILMTFSNEFNPTPLSIAHYIMGDVSEVDWKWLLKIEKTHSLEYICSRLPEIPRDYIQKYLMNFNISCYIEQIKIFHPHLSK